MSKLLRVVIVEDSADDAELLVLALRRGGIDLRWTRVESATGLRAALAAESCNVVLADYSLPGFTAEETLRIVHEVDEDLPVIVVSGTVGEETAVALMRAGAADYILKSALARLAPAVEREVLQSESRRTHRRSQQEARRLAAIVLSSQDAIVGTTLDGTIIDWNPAAERLFGWSAAEVVGRPLSMLTSPECRKARSEAIANVCRTGKAELFETTCLCKNGERLSVADTISPIRSAEGEVIGLSFIKRDVTRQKQAEEVMARDSLLLASVQDSIIVTDPDGVVTYWNQGAMRTFGWTREEMLGQPLAKRYPQSERPWIKMQIQQIASGNDWIGEYEDWRKDGSRVWINARVTRITGPDGRVLGILGISHDVTERKQAEAELQASEQRYRDLVETSHDLIWSVDAEGRITFLNQAAKSIYGRDPEDMVGKLFFDFVPPDQVATDRAAFRHSIETGVDTVDYESRVYRKDGSIATLSANARILRDTEGNITGVSGISRDVSAAKEAEQALRDREELLAKAQRIAHFGSWELDIEANRLKWSEETLKIFGVQPEQFGGTFQSFFDRVHADDKPALVRALNRADAGCGTIDVEYRIVRPDGKQRIVHVRGEVTFGAKGRPIRRMGVVMDITDRKRAEEQLQRTSGLLQAVAEGTPDAIFVKDRAGKYLYFNGAAARFVGRPAEEVLGADDSLIFDPASVQIVRQNDRRVMETGRTETKEEELTAAGVKRTYLATKSPLKDSAGNVVGLIGISRDITERRQSARALEESEERFRAFMNFSPAAAWLTDAAARYIYTSSRYTQTFQLADPHPVGKTVYDVFPEIRARACAEKIREVARTGKLVEMIETVTRADGSSGVFSVHLFPVPHRHSTALVGGIALDVTERVQAEEALRLRDRAIQAVSQGILITDPNQPDNPIIYASPGFERLTGYRAEECLGRNCRFLQGEETDPVAVERLRKAIKTTQPCTVELLNYRKDGSSFWNEVSISPVRGADGNVAHFVGVQMDVTHRRRLEEQLRQAQKMEAIGQLAGGVSHDFNNLLTVINGYSEILQSQTPPTEAAWELLDEIRKAGERSSQLTRQLLAFSRKQVLSSQILDLSAVVTGAQKLLHRLIGEDVELVTMLASDLWPIRADAGQIEQVALNLAVNARDAMPTGGRITIETRNVIVDEEDALANPELEPGPHVLLSVSDTGEGMSPQVKSRIFEPFFTTKQRGQGTGLGLAVVHGIIKQSGGYIKVDSAPGEGSTFSIYFPRVAKQSPSAESSPMKETWPRGTEAVLLVEDEDGVRSLASRILINCGYSVLVAANGAEAISLADRSERIDVLITDVVMPGLSGRELAEELSRKSPGLKVLFLSGYTDDAIVRHGVLHSSVHFLQKPFSPLDLAKKVRNVLDEAH